MSESQHDEQRTALALGEPADGAAPELSPQERARLEQVSTLAREVLRGDEVPGLTAPQRVEILRRAERRAQPRPRRLWLLAACLSVFAVAFGAYFGMVRPAQERALVAEQARLAQERELQAQERELAAQQKLREQQEAKIKALRAQWAEVELMQAREDAAKATTAPSVADIVPHEGRERPSTRAIRPPSGARSSSGSSGGCDPSDPLCGL